MTEVPIAWYITYGDESGYNNVLFFKTEQAAHDAVDEMQRINDEEGEVYYTYRGFCPIALMPSHILEEFQDV